MDTNDTNDGFARNLLAALKFAAEKHSQQRRKDVEATPYINHPIAVAELLAGVGKVDDLAALHALTMQDVTQAFSPEKVNRKVLGFFSITSHHRD